MLASNDIYRRMWNLKDVGEQRQVTNNNRVGQFEEEQRLTNIERPTWPKLISNDGLRITTKLNDVHEQRQFTNSDQIGR